MKKIGIAAFIVFCVGLLVYLAFPQPSFPDTLWDFVVSKEPADNETPSRRGYYTNLTREQLMSHYRKEFGWGLVLNYPPEEAQTLIRDQTHATFLEEIVHPFRESLFVSGNEPGPDEPVMAVDGKKFKQKVIVRYVGSSLGKRLGVGALTLGVIWFLALEWIREIKTLRWNSR